MNSVPMFYLIYFEFLDAGFREVCYRTSDIVPGGRSPSPICTVVSNHKIEKGNIFRRNDTQPPEDGISEVLYTVSTLSAHCSELLLNRESTSHTLRALCEIDFAYTHIGV
jgi:hypothetical protein